MCKPETPARAGETDWVARLLSDRPFVPEDQELKFAVHGKLLERVTNGALSPFEASARHRAEIKRIVCELVTQESAVNDPVEEKRLADEITGEALGLGPLEPLLQDPGISDILVNTSRQVFIERQGKLYRTPVAFKDDAHLLRVIEKVVCRVGRHVDASSPLVDARLPDGSRVNAAIPPVAVDGPSLSIRRFGRGALTGADLVEKLSLTGPMLEFLKACV